MSYQFREVCEDDIWTLYNWANEAECRKSAFHTEIIKKDEHEKWFHEKTRNPFCYIFIYNNAKESLGQVRLEVENRRASIDYSIDRIYRGLGLGFSMMEQLEVFIREKHLPINQLLAVVKKDNIASNRIFQKLNYQKTEKEDVILYRKAI